MTRPHIDFGAVATDYARHRPGFPDAFFDYIRRYAIGARAQDIADVGCGTGTLARGFAARGCRAVGVDPSPEMLAQAVALTRADGVEVSYVRGWAEATGLAAGRFDLICAGQCWHWFDRGRAAVEVARLLRPNGQVLIAYLSYLSDPGTVGAETESLVLKHNRGWQLAGSDGRPVQFAEDVQALGPVEIFDFDLDLSFTHESWRGRLRACNGVFVMPSEAVAAFDADLAAMLAGRYPNPMLVPHRIFGIVAKKVA
jgi:SAM-dependent methyltransferase